MGQADGKGAVVGLNPVTGQASYDAGIYSGEFREGKVLGMGTYTSPFKRRAGLVYTASSFQQTTGTPPRQSTHNPAAAKTTGSSQGIWRGTWHLSTALRPRQTEAGGVVPAGSFIRYRGLFRFGITRQDQGSFLAKRRHVDNENEFGPVPSVLHIGHYWRGGLKPDLN